MIIFPLVCSILWAKPPNKSTQMNKDERPNPGGIHLANVTLLPVHIFTSLQVKTL